MRPAQPSVLRSTFARFGVATLAAAVLFAVAFVPRPPAARASWDWCWDDPILRIDGKQINVNVGVYGAAADVRKYVSVATVTIYLPRGVTASVVGYTNVHFRESARFVYVNWLPYQKGKVVGTEIHTTFTMARGAPVMDAKVDVTHSGYRYAGNSGKTSTGVKVQHQIYYP